MLLLVTRSNVCRASVQISPPAGGLVPTLSVAKFSEGFWRHYTGIMARVTRFYCTPHDWVVSGIWQECSGGGKGPGRGLSTSSVGRLTTKCRDMGSILSYSMSVDRAWGFFGGYIASGIQGDVTRNGGSLFVPDGSLRRRLSCHRLNSSRGLAIRCLISVPDPNQHSVLEMAATAAEGGGILTDLYVANTAENPKESVKAAFFDVDGTITRTNVVLAYLCIRMAELPFLKKLLWVPWFVLSCIVYLMVDHFHRPTFNRIFYLSYKGRPTDCKAAMATLVYEKYYKPRIMAGALEQILELKQLGYHIVLVTGALDFHIAPLAEELGADFVYAAKLVEENGIFTGGLDGMASSNSEKAERIWDYAKRHGVSLRESLAFGDSIADIPMLEVVGRPYAVNPDARLQSIALKRGWAILNWKVKTKKRAAAGVWAILKWRMYKDRNAETLHTI